MSFIEYDGKKYDACDFLPGDYQTSDKILWSIHNKTLVVYASWMDIKDFLPLVSKNKNTKTLKPVYAYAAISGTHNGWGLRHGHVKIFNALLTYKGRDIFHIKPTNKKYQIIEDAEWLL